jgi:hypothetical protein
MDIFHPFGPVILTVNLSQKQKNSYTLTYISAECVKCVSSPELYWSQCNEIHVNNL